ncbi:hypothetical protein [Nocardioides sp.]|uniref:hypothetical protein n=1 Tax=Nocardioides sp. TaxID=35761 RepID=UPI003219F6EE
MSERERILSSLGKTDVLWGIRWAYESAARRTREDYDDPTGHNATWVGINRWILLCDRLDRVFSCGRYATREHSPGAVGLDILYATLTDEEQATFPHIPPGTVVRDDLVGSPGWSNGDVRWLLASAEFGGVDEINWSRRSQVKQRTAKQIDPDNDQLSILDVLMDDPGAAKLREALERAIEFDITTLVVTHTHDIDTNDRELYLGLPSMEDRDTAWAWKENLLTAPPADGGRQTPPASEPDGPSNVPDAPVRLRAPAEKAAPRTKDDASRASEGR